MDQDADALPFDAFTASGVAPPASAAPLDPQGNPYPAGDIVVRRHAPAPPDPATPSPSSSPTLTSLMTSGAPAPPPVDPNAPLPFEAFKSGAPPDPTWQSLGAAPAVGFNEGLADTLGAPVDFTNWLMGKAGVPVSQTPFGGSESIKRGLGLIGANPEDIPPRSQLERILQAGGAGAAGMIAPEAVLGGATQAGLQMAPRVGEALNSAFGSASSAPAVAKTAVVGATAGGTGELAAQQFPEGSTWQKAARLAGNIVGGGFGAVAVETPAVIGAAKNFAAPMTAAGPSRIAGQTLSDALTSRAATMDKLQNASPSDFEPVPGVRLNSFQFLGDMGLGGLERTMATKTTNQGGVEMPNSVLFNADRGAQTQGLNAALGNIQTTGAPEDVSTYLRARLDDLDAHGEAIQNQAVAQSQAAATGLGGDQSPAFYGEAIRNEVFPQVQAATADAASQVSALGGAGTVEDAGAALRAPYQAATEALRQQRNGLYDAVDPDGKLNAVFSPVKDATEGFYAKQSGMAKGPTGEEAAIKSKIEKAPDVIPFNDLRALDSRITAAMSEERRASGETPMWGRLKQLKGYVSSAIDNGVANQVAYERGAVARGAVPAENTIDSRLQAWEDSLNAQQQQAGVANGPGKVGTVARGQTATDAGVLGTESQGNGRPGNIARDTRSAPPAVPNIDAAAAERLNAAKQANIAYQANKKGLLGSIIKSAGFNDPKMLASAVPDTVFAKGPSGYERAMTYRRAVNDDPAAIAAMHDFAAQSLRQVAEKPDGTLDPAKFQTWSKSHAEAMRAFPELADRFSTAAKASEALNRFEPFRADMAPYQVPEMFFHSGSGGADGVANLRRLIGPGKADPILEDYAAAKLKSMPGHNPDGTLNPAVVDRFTHTHASAIGEVPGLKDKFSSTAEAQRTVDRVAVARKQARDGYMAGAIGKVMNAAPEDVVGHIGAIFGSKDSAAQMGRLAAAAASDKTGAATAGLRKAIAEHINSKFISNTEAGASGSNLVKSDPFQTFMRQKSSTLAKVFSPEEIEGMNRMASALHSINRSVTAVKLPGGPGTAQDLTAVGKNERAKPEPLFRQVAEGAVGGHVIGSAAGPVAAIAGGAAGAGAAIGKHVLGGMREAGYRKADELVVDALRDPEKMKALLAKVPMRSDRGSDMSLKQQLRRLSVFSSANQLAPHHRSITGILRK